MKTVGLLIETSREYGRELLKGVAEYAQERREWLLRLLAPSDLSRCGALDGFDGIITRTADERTSDILTSAGIPVVDAFCQQVRRGVSGVDCDHASIARTAAGFFLDRGFTSFAFCGFGGTAFSDARCAAFSSAVSEAGFACETFSDAEPPGDDIVFAERADPPRRPALLRRWLKSLPPQTALFCANDIRAYQVTLIARDAGLRIPSDIAILGVDNDTVLCSFAPTPISSIDPNARGVGRAAAQLLDAAIETPAAKDVHSVHRVRPGRLVERASTEHHPVEPPWLADLLVFIDRNLSRPLAAADVIAQAGRSHTTVEKAFRATFGESVGHYIMRLKMGEAKRLLAKGCLSGKEVAANIGIASPQYFCRLFRAFFGHSPFTSPRPESRL